VAVRVLIKIFWQIRVKLNELLSRLVLVELQGDNLSLVKEHGVLSDCLNPRSTNLSVFLQILHLFAEINQHVIPCFLGWSCLLGTLRLVHSIVLDANLTSSNKRPSSIKGTWGCNIIEQRLIYRFLHFIFKVYKQNTYFSI
jgi:hypothetical protein